MPGPNFVVLAIKATAAVDARMAEPFSWTPMMAAVDKTAPDVVDSARVATIVNAIYLFRPEKAVMPNSYDVRQARRPGVESGAPRLKISPSEIANQIALNASFAVSAGDKFERVADGVAFRVSSIEALSGSALVCYVNEL